MVVGCQHHAQATLPPGKTRYLLYRRLGGRSAGQDGCGKSRPPPGFDPRTTSSRRESLSRPTPLLEETIHKIAQCIFNVGYTVATSGRPTLPWRHPPANSLSAVCKKRARVQNNTPVSSVNPGVTVVFGKPVCHRCGASGSYSRCLDDNTN